MQGRQHRILLVDDDQTLREHLSDLLKDHEWQVEEASNGAEALRKLHTTHYDAVLSDVFTPEMDGYQLIRAIRNRWSDMPVVMMSGGYAALNAKLATELGSKLGATQILQKPFSRRDLYEAVKSALETRYQPA